MGNSSSVTVANITASKELLPIWNNNFIFKARFIDDIFSIIDVTEIQDIPFWITNTFSHSFLKFDVMYDKKQVNFLDLCISLQDNILSTSCYEQTDVCSLLFQPP